MPGYSGCNIDGQRILYYQRRDTVLLREEPAG